MSMDTEMRTVGVGEEKGVLAENKSLLRTCPTFIEILSALWLVLFNLVHGCMTLSTLQLRALMN